MTDQPRRYHHFRYFDSASALLAGRLVTHHTRPGRFVWILENGNGGLTFPIEVYDGIRDNPPDPEVTVQGMFHIRWNEERGRVDLSLARVRPLSDRHWNHYEIRGTVEAIDGHTVTLRVTPRNGEIEPFTVPVQAPERCLAMTGVGERLHTECVVRQRLLRVKNWDTRLPGVS